MTFDVYDDTSAPEAARAPLAQTTQRFGGVLNLLGTMAGSPELLKGYLTLASLFDQTSLTPTERQVVLLAASVVHRSGYDVAAHTTIARMQQVDPDVVQAVRHEAPIADERLDALRRFAAAVAQTDGRPGIDASRAFEEAGYGSTQALEVVLGVGMKALSIATNHLAATPVDDRFTAGRWEPVRA